MVKKRTKNQNPLTMTPEAKKTLEKNLAETVQRVKRDLKERTKK